MISNRLLHSSWTRPVLLLWHNTRPLLDPSDFLLSQAMVSLDNLLQLAAASKITLPTLAWALETVLKCFGSVLATLLGHTSYLFREFDHGLLGNFGELGGILEAKGDPLIYAQVLRAVQLEIHEYWKTSLLSGRTARPPDFGLIPADIARDRWIVPSLPSGYVRNTPPRAIASESASRRSPSTSAGRFPDGTIRRYSSEP